LEIDAKMWTEQVEQNQGSDNHMRWVAYHVIVLTYIVCPMIELDYQKSTYNTKVGNFFIIICCLIMILNVFNYKIECIMGQIRCCQQV
jgi:uncharacterized membrane protein SirB2